MKNVNEAFTLYNKIGNGAFSAVYLGKDNSNNKCVAIKKVNKAILINNISKIYFNNEIYILKHLPHHNNIIQYNTLYQTLSSYYVVTEYCNGGSLETALSMYYVKHKRPLSESIARYICKEIINGLYYLHSNNIIHRDIKAENILLHYSNENDLINCTLTNAQVKIIDFGFARLLAKNESTASSVIGTPLFMDPLILRKTVVYGNGSSSSNNKCDYDYKVDIWSFGVIAYQMLMGVIPFNGESCNELYVNVKERKFCLPNIKHFTLSKGCIEFLDRVLHVDSNVRPSAKELLKDKWICGMVDEKERMVLKKENDIEDGNGCFKDYWNEMKVYRKSVKDEKKRHNLDRYRKIESLLGKIKNVNMDKNEERRNSVGKVGERNEREGEGEGVFMKISSVIKKVLSLSVGDFDNDNDRDNNNNDKQIKHDNHNNNTKRNNNNYSPCKTPLKEENHKIYISHKLWK